MEIKRKKKGNESKGSPLCFTSTSVAIKWLNYPSSSHEGTIERRYKLPTAVSTESKLQGLTWQTNREVRHINVWCSRSVVAFIKGKQKFKKEFLNAVSALKLFQDIKRDGLNQNA